MCLITDISTGNLMLHLVTESMMIECCSYQCENQMPFILLLTRIYKEYDCVRVCHHWPLRILCYTGADIFCEQGKKDQVTIIDRQIAQSLTVK